MNYREQLKESEDVFRLLFEESGDAHLLIDEGRYIDCNEAALKIMGASDKSQIINLTPAETSAEKQPDGSISSEIFKENINIAMSSGRHRFEWLQKRFDGSETYSDVMLTAISMKGKTLLYTTWRDINARKQMENALRESEERNRILSSLSFEGISIHRDGKLIDANETFVSMLGYGSLGEILGRNVFEFIAPDCQGISSKNIRNGFEGNYEITRVKKDGTCFPAEIIVKNILYNGMPARVVSTRDITESKIAEEQLKESERKYRNLIETTMDIIYSLDGEGCFTYVNPRFEFLTGYSLSELSGKPFVYVLPNEHKRKTIEQFFKVMQGENISRYETDLLTRSGERIPVEFVMSNIFDRRGKTCGRFGIGRDMTERRRMEEELSREHDRLASILDGIPIRPLL